MKNPLDNIEDILIVVEKTDKALFVAEKAFIQIRNTDCSLMLVVICKQRVLILKSPPGVLFILTTEKIN